MCADIGGGICGDIGGGIICGDIGGGINYVEM